MHPCNILTDPTHSFQPLLAAPKASTHILLHARKFPHLNIILFSLISVKNLGICRTTLLSFDRSTKPEGFMHRFRPLNKCYSTGTSKKCKLKKKPYYFYLPFILEPDRGTGRPEFGALFMSQFKPCILCPQRMALPPIRLTQLTWRKTRIMYLGGTRYFLYLFSVLCTEVAFCF